MRFKGPGGNYIVARKDPYYMVLKYGDGDGFQVMLEADSKMLADALAKRLSQKGTLENLGEIYNNRKYSYGANLSFWPPKEKVTFVGTGYSYEKHPSIPKATSKGIGRE
jgi:hypothetical protein